MKTVVLAPQELWEELQTTLKNTQCVRVSDTAEFAQFDSNDVYFNLHEDAETLTYRNDAIIFINCTNQTLSESNQPANVFSINAWNGFLKRDKWEITGRYSFRMEEYISSVGKELLSTPDMKGFISCRIISMIVNEAYFTLGESVSSKDEIDIAMKLGTNYPKGPFEWSKEIGINKMYNLLNVLSKEDPIYTPAPLLIKESSAL